MIAIVTIFERRKKSETENKGEGEILFHHKYPMLDTIGKNGQLLKGNEKKNLAQLKKIQKMFKKDFKPENFLEVQFDIEKELEEIEKMEN